MTRDFTDEELLAYAAEALPLERMSAVERRLRSDGGLRARMASLLQSQSHAGLSVAGAWREGRLTCPNRTEWGSFFLGVLDEELEDYFRFHLQVIGCRYCIANVDDLQRTTEAPPQESQERRQKFFQSSAGLVRKERDDR